MKVTFLGTASGIATKTRNQNAILLESGSRYLLLDGGEPLSIPLIRNGISCNLIDGMVISHMHSDHCGALPQLITTFQIQGKTTPFTVYLPSEGLEPLREFLRALYLAPPILEFPLNLCPIPEQETVSVGAVQLRFLPNHHLKIPAARMRTVSPQNRGESYSTELSCEGKRIIYSGDVGACLDLLPFFDRPIDLLMCEMAHFNPEEFRTLTENIKPEITAFSHFHPDYDVNPGEILKDAFAGYPNRLIFAQDGTIFEL